MTGRASAAFKKCGELIQKEMNRRVLLKQIGNGLLLLVIIILTYKFLAWNYWKLDMSVATARDIVRAPAAVNLTLSSETGALFKTGFAPNPEGHFYIVNQWDLAPYIKMKTAGAAGARKPVPAIKKGLRVFIDGNEIENGDLKVYLFRRYRILSADKDGRTVYFVFISENCGIDHFVKIKDRLPGIIDTIEKLTNR
jgi:hypothetical protein